MDDFARRPKFIMCYLFPVDSILIDGDANADALDKTRLCLPDDRDVIARMLHLFRPIPASQIISDLREMGLTGLLCVGVDGSSLRIEEIRSGRYVGLIRECQEAGLMFIHSLPFADTYDNEMTRKWPHIKQRTFDGTHPAVGWSAMNSHVNIDYGSAEFVDFCRRSIDALKQVGVSVIDYGEPDHYPLPDNGYGESLTRAWTEETGEEAPHPSTVRYRRFMEDRNIEGMNAISDYAHESGFADHLTASPLLHPPFLICQNYGKYSRTRVSQLSTTYHEPYAQLLTRNIRSELDMNLPECRLDGIGCVESKSMRAWDERHAVYLAAGQGHPLERLKGMLETIVLVHQMDVFFWDYGNFRNQSMYLNNRFEEPARKYAEFKQLIRSTIDTYESYPEDYRGSVVAPDAVICYSKLADYVYHIRKDQTRLPGAYSLYSIASKLQNANIAFMFAYDEHPEVLQRDAKDTPLLIVDGYQMMSEDFVRSVVRWFGPGKAVLCGGELPETMRSTVNRLGEELGPTETVEEVTIDGARNSDYSAFQPAFSTDSWAELLKWSDRPIAFQKGTAETGVLAYSPIPLSRLYQVDLKAICDKLLLMVGRAGVTLSADFRYEVELVKYTNGAKKFLAIKNHGSPGALTVTSKEKPAGCYPRDDELLLTHTDRGFELEMNFRADEARIIGYDRGR